MVNIFFLFTYFDQNLSREIEIIKDNNKFVVYDKKNLSKYDYTPYLKRVISSKIFRIFSLKESLVLEIIMALVSQCL